MICLPGRAYYHRRGMIIMKGTNALVIYTSFMKVGKRLYDIYDVQCALYFIYEIFIYHDLIIKKV